MDEKLVKLLVQEILNQLGRPQSVGDRIPLETSARHVHLSQRHVEALFGPGYTLTPKRDLSQPGQFLCEERVRLIGPKGEIAGVAVLGPARSATQAELSMTDARALGVKAPVRMSGDLRDAGSLAIMAGENIVAAGGCAIVAQNHIHMTPEDAARLGVADRQQVRVRVQSQRSLTFEGVAVRVDPRFRLGMHIDFDEANACLACGEAFAVLESAGGIAAVAGAGPLCSTAPVSPAPGAYRCREKLITEEIAKKIRAEGATEVILPPKAIVTALARDVFCSARIAVKAGEGAC